ncbi:hypothetical protein [Sphingobium sp. RAC03]|uniref:hypothetical protein n=1 Tax=Sphingobium sp. RAC03 TaxID=1843368 RepID=UPI00083CB8AC|nr:hypothetical protein [Sphingobium sp. RAC03]AOF95961.1 hypothetical protein BSY17_2687 [Sphingobium sp. RAC03]
MSGFNLAAAIDRSKEAGQKALYFGPWGQPGHYLHDQSGQSLWEKEAKALQLPWGFGLMDGGLLKNGKRPDNPDGRVWWTCGGLTFWYAFYWWDRSVDKRGASNSGFYVRGFGWPETEEAFAYACAAFPSVIARQKHRLILQDPSSKKDINHEDWAERESSEGQNHTPEQCVNSRNL